MAMTHEFFINICKMIKAGSKTLELPCCANCLHYKPKNVPNHRCINYICEHPAEEYPLDSRLLTKPEDFYSYFEERKDG